MDVVEWMLLSGCCLVDVVEWMLLIGCCLVDVVEWMLLSGWRSLLVKVLVLIVHVSYLLLNSSLVSLFFQGSCFDRR